MSRHLLLLELNPHLTSNDPYVLIKLATKNRFTDCLERIDDFRKVIALSRIFALGKFQRDTGIIDGNIISCAILPPPFHFGFGRFGNGLICDDVFKNIIGILSIILIVKV